MMTGEGSGSSLTPESSPAPLLPRPAHCAPPKEAFDFELSFEPVDSFVSALQGSPQQEARHKSGTRGLKRSLLKPVSPLVLCLVDKSAASRSSEDAPWVIKALIESYIYDPRVVLRPLRVVAHGNDTGAVPLPSLHRRAEYLAQRHIAHKRWSQDSGFGSLSSHHWVLCTPMQAKRVA